MVECAAIAIRNDLPSDARALLNSQMTRVELHVSDLDAVVLNFRAGSMVMLLRLLIDDRHSSGAHRLMARCQVAALLHNDNI